jgi:hypothetical protein
MKGILSRYVQSVSAGPTQGCAVLNHQVLIMKVSAPTPEYHTGREGSVNVLPLPLGARYATVR